MIVLILALSACAGTRTTSHTMAGTAATYSSAHAVIAALGRDGLSCTGEDDSSPPVMHGATSEASCHLGSSEADEALIDVFPDGYAVTYAEVSTNSVSTGTQQIWTVYGPNWLLQADTTYVHRVMKILGGKILAGPRNPQSASPPSPSAIPLAEWCQGQGFQDYQDVDNDLNQIKSDEGDLPVLEGEGTQLFRDATAAGTHLRSGFSCQPRSGMSARRNPRRRRRPREQSQRSHHRSPMAAVSVAGATSSGSRDVQPVTRGPQRRTWTGECAHVDLVKTA